MTVRIILLLALLAAPAFAQRRSLFGQNPPKPKVIATPTPAPAPAAKPKTAPKRKPAPAPKPQDPLEEYTPLVKAAFAARWVEVASPLVKDFDPGTVSVLFKLDAGGKVLDVQVTDNTSNEAFAKFCEQFVRDTPFEKPPEKALSEGAVQIPFTFRVY